MLCAAHTTRQVCNMATFRPIACTHGKLCPHMTSELALLERGVWRRWQKDASPAQHGLHCSVSFEQRWRLQQPTDVPYCFRSHPPIVVQTSEHHELYPHTAHHHSSATQYCIDSQCGAIVWADDRRQLLDPIGPSPWFNVWAYDRSVTQWNNPARTLEGQLSKRNAGSNLEPCRQCSKAT